MDSSSLSIGLRQWIAFLALYEGKKLQEIDTLRDDISSSASTATEAKTKIRLAYVEREDWKDCVAPCKYAHG